MNMKIKLAACILFGAVYFCALVVAAASKDRTDKETKNASTIDQATLEAWSAPFRGWHYYPDPIIPEVASTK